MNPAIDLLSQAAEVILAAPFAWCYVSEGAVTLEDAQERGGTRGGQFLVSSFAMAKYPVTNAQYARFLEHANGFANLEWWSFSSEARRWRSDRPSPRPSAFPGPTLPRTHVSWFDAMAFCRWLSAEMHSHMPDPSGQVRLPTEEEWQRAALGDSGWHYPCGNELTDANANFAKDVGHPTPVETYADSCSPFGVVDMVGNVWEWTLTPWGIEEFDLDGYTYRIIKGGAWNVSNPTHLRPADRSGHPPRGRLNDCGFRCAYHPSRKTDKRTT